tara:strand:+ start:301 stop:531 length:231 start_codon:yes stop_codon:yes gene_type:complete
MKYMTTNKIIVIALGVSLWCSNALNKKYNNISKKLDMIVENSEKGKIDSLQFEIMYLGSKLDSMILEHDYGFTFTD